MRAKRKRVRGQFPRRRAGWAVYVLLFISFSRHRRPDYCSRTHLLLQCFVSDRTLATPSYRPYLLATMLLGACDPHCFIMRTRLVFCMTGVLELDLT